MYLGFKNGHDIALVLKIQRATAVLSASHSVLGSARTNWNFKNNPVSNPGPIASESLRWGLVIKLCFFKPFYYGNVKDKTLSII